MRLVCTILAAGLLVQVSYSQNLVPNPSFEDTTGCPNGVNQVYKAKFWANPTQASPDYYNSCDAMIWGQNVPYTGFGFQSARTGNAFTGFYAFQKIMPNYREYVQVKLTDTLTAGRKYLAFFYVNLSNISQYSISSIGAFFSATPISSSNTGVLNYTPQLQNVQGIQLNDSVQWMLIQDTLVANGTESYLTIGNFKVDGQSDTTYHGWWSSNNIAYYYVDDVSVIDVEALGIHNNKNKYDLTLYPNPANNDLEVKCWIKRGAIDILDLMGNIIKHEYFSEQIQINVSDLASGVYFVRVRDSQRQYTRKFVKE